MTSRRSAHFLFLRRIFKIVYGVVGLVQLGVLGCRGGIHILEPWRPLPIKVRTGLDRVCTSTPLTSGTKHVCLPWCLFGSVPLLVNRSGGRGSGREDNLRLISIWCLLVLGTAPIFVDLVLYWLLLAFDTASCRARGRTWVCVTARALIRKGWHNLLELVCHCHPPIDLFAQCKAQLAP